MKEHLWVLIASTTMGNCGNFSWRVWMSICSITSSWAPLKASGFTKLCGTAFELFKPLKTVGQLLKVCVRLSVSLSVFPRKEKAPWQESQSNYCKLLNKSMEKLTSEISFIISLHKLTHSLAFFCLGKWGITICPAKKAEVARHGSSCR